MLLQLGTGSRRILVPSELLCFGQYCKNWLNQLIQLQHFLQTQLQAVELLLLLSPVLPSLLQDFELFVCLSVLLLPLAKLCLQGMEQLG